VIANCHPHVDDNRLAEAS